jgi:hypothetical protein
VEVAHEALLTHWPRLDTWIKERFDDLRLLRQVRLEAAEWQRRGRMEAHLWRHERLQPVYEMCQRLQPVLLVRLSQNSRFSIFNGAKRLRCFQ